jgi:serine/threonine-protein phosphatase 2A regulatory subunit B'
MEKEATLGEPIIKGLLKFWPKTCSTKEVRQKTNERFLISIGMLYFQVLFLSELEEILDIIDSQVFKCVCAALFKQITRSATSSHFQVNYRHRMHVRRTMTI